MSNEFPHLCNKQAFVLVTLARTNNATGRLMRAFIEQPNCKV
jgi:hypothetical protein